MLLEKLGTRKDVNPAGIQNWASIHGSRWIQIEICDPRKSIAPQMAAAWLETQWLETSTRLLGAWCFWWCFHLLVSNDDGGGTGGKSDSHYVNVGKILG